MSESQIVLKGGVETTIVLLQPGQSDSGNGTPWGNYFPEETGPLWTKPSMIPEMFPGIDDRLEAEQIKNKELNRLRDQEAAKYDQLGEVPEDAVKHWKLYALTRNQYPYIPPDFHCRFFGDWSVYVGELWSVEAPDWETILISPNQATNDCWICPNVGDDCSTRYVVPPGQVVTEHRTLLDGPFAGQVWQGRYFAGSGRTVCVAFIDPTDGEEKPVPSPTPPEPPTWPPTVPPPATPPRAKPPILHPGTVTVAPPGGEPGVQFHLNEDDSYDVDFTYPPCPCEDGEDGLPGEPGPAGSAGAQGPQGPQGVKGDKGDAALKPLFGVRTVRIVQPGQTAVRLEETGNSIYEFDFDLEEAQLEFVKKKLKTCLIDAATNKYKEEEFDCWFPKDKDGNDMYAQFALMMYAIDAVRIRLNAYCGVEDQDPAESLQDGEIQT